METKIFTWLGREFVEISGEAPAGASVETATAELFELFDGALKSQGLSLDHTARIRIFGRNRQSRTDATLARSKILSGSRRAASSSFISQPWFDSASSAGLELLVLRPLNTAVQRKPVDFEPARNYFFQNSSLNSFSYSATLRNMSAGT